MVSNPNHKGRNSTSKEMQRANQNGDKIFDVLGKQTSNNNKSMLSVGNEKKNLRSSTEKNTPSKKFSSSHNKKFDETPNPKTPLKQTESKMSKTYKVFFLAKP